jgi:outer membrane protein insertion porin family
MRHAFKAILIIFIIGIGPLMASPMTINDLRFVDDQSKPIDATAVVMDLENQVGTDFNPEKLLGDIELLKSRLPRYQKIVATIDPDKDEEGLILSFQFQIKRTVQAVRIMLDSDMEEELNLHEDLLTAKGNLFHTRNLEADRITLTEKFKKRGYPNVLVSHSLHSKNSTKVQVRFHISLGSKKMKVYDIKFHGNSGIDEDYLLEKMTIHTRGFFLSSRPVFDITELEQDLKSVITYYQQSGYNDAKITTRVDYKKDLVTLHFNIIEGPRYMVKQVKVATSETFPAASLVNAFNYRKNSPYNEKELRQALQRLREFLGSKGYPLSQALIDYDSDSSVVTLYVREGMKQKIEEVEVVGNIKMKASTILLDVNITPGEIVNTKKIDETLKNLRGSGYYSDVSVDYSPLTATSGKIIISVKEASTQVIQFTAGMSSAGTTGGVSYSNKNLFGTGKTVSVHAMVSEELYRIGLLYRDPHFVGTDYEMEVNLNYDTQFKPSYDQEKVSFRIMIEKKLNENLKLGIGTRVEFVNIDNIDSELKPHIHDATDSGTVIGLISTMVYKNEQYDSTGQVKNGFRMKLAMMPSHGDQGLYIKTFTEIVGSKSLGTNESGASHTISGKVTLGYASENTPYYEKYNAGGIGTIRGFDSSSITPSGSPSGANVLVATNGTYSFPIWKDRLKGVIFVEAASVGEGFSDLGDIRAVGGMGLRANLRDTFLSNSIEAGFALPIIQQDGDSLKPFYFMFGDYDPAYDL